MYNNTEVCNTVVCEEEDMMTQEQKKERLGLTANKSSRLGK